MGKTIRNYQNDGMKRIKTVKPTKKKNKQRFDQWVEEEDYDSNIGFDSNSDDYDYSDNG